MTGAEQATEAGVRLDIVDRHVAIITLDRPAKRNAITGAMAAALDGFVKATEADPDIRAVVIASSGKVFCAGADLGEVAAGRATSLRTPDGGFAGLVFQPHAKPWIAAVSGPALAGGLEIALACDMILSVPEAIFGLPEATRGILAGAGGVFRLPHLLPRGLAIEMVVTGKPIDAAEAHRHGLVNRLVPAERLLDEAIGVARTIAANAPLAVAEGLAIARIAAEHGDADLRRIASAAADRVLASEDVKEGARAFVEKRAPVWQGR